MQHTIHFIKNIPTIPNRTSMKRCSYQHFGWRKNKKKLHVHYTAGCIYVLL